MNNIQVQYYAVLREQAGRSEESVHTEAATPVDLYRELQARYGFSLPQALLRVAVNDEFCGWDRALAPGDRVVFIPPVAGG
jgi:molybdopterin converting factor small subunit